MAPIYCSRCGQPSGSGGFHLCEDFKAPPVVKETLDPDQVLFAMAEILKKHRWISSVYAWTGCSCDRLWWKGYENNGELENMYRVHVADQLMKQVVVNVWDSCFDWCEDMFAMPVEKFDPFEEWR